MIDKSGKLWNGVLQLGLGSAFALGCLISTGFIDNPFDSPLSPYLLHLKQVGILDPRGHTIEPIYGHALIVTSLAVILMWIVSIRYNGARSRPKPSQSKILKFKGKH